MSFSIGSLACRPRKVNGRTLSTISDSEISRIRPYFLRFDHFCLQKTALPGQGIIPDLHSLKKTRQLLQARVGLLGGTKITATLKRAFRKNMPRGKTRGIKERNPQEHPQHAADYSSSRESVIKVTLSLFLCFHNILWKGKTFALHRNIDSLELS
jgi:hypothetical protein